MANEFKLSYTGSEINEKLGKIDEIDNAVLYTEQTLTEAQKAQARANIGIGNVINNDNGSGDGYITLTGVNILNPDNVSFDDWYYSTEDGETIVSKPDSIRINTVEKIKLPRKTNMVYVTLDTTSPITTYGVIIYSYNESGFLGQYSHTIDRYVSIPVDVYPDATHIRFYSNLNIDPNVRFCITLDPVEEFKEYEELSIPDNSGSSDNLDSSEINEKLGKIDEITEIVNQLSDEKVVKYTAQTLTEEQKAQARANIGIGNTIADGNGYIILTGENILNPDNIIFENWYYSTDDGESIVETTTPRSVTTDKIKIPENTKKVYVTTDTVAEMPTTSGLMVYSYDDNGFLGVYSKTLSRKNSIGIDIHEGATHIRFFSNFYADPNIRYCITLEEVTEFKEYEEILVPSAYGSGKVLPFAGKTIVNFGDSIYGGKRPPYDVSTVLANLTGAVVYNCGFGGCRMAQHTSEKWDAFSMYRLADAIVGNDFSTQVNAIANDTYNELPSYFADTVKLLKLLNFNNVDIITIGYGINDHSKENVLDSEENPKDVATFAGALRYSLEALLTAFPHLKIFVCGQTYRAWLNDDYTFNEDSNTMQNDIGVKLTEFVAKTEEVAKEYHTPFIDLYYSLGINKFNRLNWFPANDGVHHNVAGAELIAARIARELF